MKCVLLSWPLGKALVFSTPSISIHLRGSQQAHDAFMRKLDSIWPSILSRSELNQVLASTRQRETLDLPSPEYNPLSPLRVSPSSESLQSLHSKARCPLLLRPWGLSPWRRRQQLVLLALMSTHILHAVFLFTF
uniref:Uncharacterized protein n=1 Tax=Cacopsylla melanoneura TaxID=428564 RepID=A0A8D8R165_9HEMI